MRFILLFAVYVLFVSLFISLKGNGFEKEVKANIQQFNETYPQEKVHMHLDNGYYYTGDTVWFKAYITDAGNKPSELSKVLYVELLDETRRIVRRDLYRIQDGYVSGLMVINPNQRVGNFMIRAYTQWMLNVSENNYYSKVFTVYGNIFNRDYQVPKLRETLTNIRFFPEGGALVQGLKSKVAYEITNYNGKDEKCAIVNAVGDTVVLFNINNSGLWEFEITPFENENYKSFLLTDSISYEVPFPYIRKEGLTAEITEDDRFYIFKINKSGYFRRNESGYILQNRNEVIASGIITDLLQIDKTTLPPGISKITFFASNGMPVWERLLFSDNYSPLKIQIITDKDNYLPREKVEIKIKVTDYAGEPVQTELSLAVTDSIIPDIKETIISDLLFNSELNGRIDNPEYYLDPDNRNELDLLLLTKGWRNYTWKQQIGAEPVNFEYPLEKNILLQGHLDNVHNWKQREIESHDCMINVNLMENGTIKFYRTIRPDKNGFFAFTTDFDQIKEIILTAECNNEPVLAEFKNVFKRFPPAVLFERFDVASFLDAELKDYMKYTSFDSLKIRNLLLEEVDVKTKSRYDDSKKIGIDATLSLLRKNGFEFKNTIDFIAHSVPCFTVRYDESFGYWLDNQCDSIFSISLNGSKYEFIMPANDTGLPVVKKKPRKNPKVYKGRKQFQLEGDADDTNIWNYLHEMEPGCFSEMEWDGRKNEIKLKQYITSVKQLASSQSYMVRGFTPYLEFYSPDYSLSDNEVKPDNRRTLYWNPRITTDKDGIATVTFYNNDTSQGINVWVECLTEEGNMGCTVLRKERKGKQ